MSKQIKNLAKYIDSTILKPEVKRDQIRKLCQEAIEQGFASVCVLPYYVSFCRKLLAESNVAVCTVVGFPLGSYSMLAKFLEAELAISKGAQEIDMVINIAAFKNRKYHTVGDEIGTMAEFTHAHDVILKVIVETCLLDEKEKIDICKIVSHTGADFIKTSTGFSTFGATVEDVKLLKKHVDKSVKVKASGGIRTREFAIELIDAGADRIGTSAGLTMVNI